MNLAFADRDFYYGDPYFPPDEPIEGLLSKDYAKSRAAAISPDHTGLTPDQFTVLRTLTEGDPRGLTQRELTRLMSSDPNTIASLLERMETAGWIERHPHETDRRAHRIRVPAPGRKKLAELRDIALQLQSEVLSVLPPAQREPFLERLAAVADACHVAAEQFQRKS
jgi:DNA-binding MarR family transcriptional regulator